MSVKNILIQKTQAYVKAYFIKNDFELVKNMFTIDGSWLGVNDNSLATKPSEFDQYFEEGCSYHYHPEITFQDSQVLYVHDGLGIVYCKYHFHLAENEILLDMDQRLTVVFKLVDGEWKILNVHASLANNVPSQKEFYQNEIGKLGYLELQRALKEKTEQIEMIVRTTAGGMKGSLDDEYYTYFYVNEELCRMLGYTYNEFMEMSGGSAVGAVYPPDLNNALADCKRCFARGAEYKTQYRMKKKDGSLLWVMDSGRKVQDENGRTVINSIITDISELKEMVNQLKIDQERYEIVAQLSNDIIFEYDINKDILEYQQPHPEAPIKTVLNHFIAQNAKEIIIHPDDKQRFETDYKMLLSSEVSHQLYKFEYRFAFISNNYIWHRLTLRRIYDNDDKLIKIIGKVVDISSELRLKQQSITDPLTGAYNRLYVTSEIQKYCQSLKYNLSYACILIDIDYFKTINDTYGHIVGDRLLIEMVKLIKGFFRTSDLVARIGGDEFLIFIKDIYDQEIVREKADALLHKVHQYITQNDYPHEISISMGIYVDDYPNVTFDELYNKIDIALYHAKNSGRDCYVFYHEGMTYPK